MLLDGDCCWHMNFGNFNKVEGLINRGLDSEYELKSAPLQKNPTPAQEGKNVGINPILKVNGCRVSGKTWGIRI